jgi:hypothetical protein
MIPKAREVRLKPKVRKVLEARCRAPTTAQRDRAAARTGWPSKVKNSETSRVRNRD